MSSDRKHLLAWLALILAVLGIVILRAPAVVLTPSLQWDEGSAVFSHFYEQRELAQILRFKSGYLPLIGNIIGYVAVRFPTRMIPYAFVGSALLITSITYGLFFARAFRKWFPSDLNRALMCLVFALAPISSSQIVTMSDYSLWNLLATLILLTACGPPETKGWKLAHGLVCNLLVWSHPLTIIIAPLVLWRAFKDEGNRPYYSLLLFNLLVHQVFGVSGIITTHGLWDHNTGVPIPVSFATKFVDSCGWTIQVVAAIAFRTAFGSPLLKFTLQEKPVLIMVWIAFLVFGGYFVARKLPRTRPVLALLAYLIVSFSFLACFLRYEDVHHNPIRFVTDSPRYLYLQSLCFLFLFGILLTTGWELARARLRGQQLVQKYMLLASLPLAGLLCYYYVLNTQLGHYFVWNTLRDSPYDDPHPQNGVIVREFFTKLAEAEESGGSRREIQLTAEKINDWSITIDTTASHRPMDFRLSHRARLLAVALTLLALGYLTRRSWMASLSRKYRQLGQT